MTYRELLKLYKQGKLEDSAKKQVEAEIEKQDAISEFLYEEGTIPDFSDLESGQERFDDSINSRIPTVVFGARDELTGSCGSVINLFEERYGHRPAVFGSVRAEESARLMKDFFREKR